MALLELLDCRQPMDTFPSPLTSGSLLHSSLLAPLAFGGSLSVSPHRTMYPNEVLVY